MINFCCADTMFQIILIFPLIICLYIYMYVLRMHDGQRGSHQRDKHTVY